MSRNAVVLLVLVLALCAFGLVMLYSATAVTAERSPRFQDDAHFLKKQLLWIMVSVAAMVVVGRVPYPTWARWRGPILLLSIALLGLVFVPGVGAQINAARRWIRVGGQFYVLACANDPEKISEVTVTNNCTASQSQVTVEIGLAKLGPIIVAFKGLLGKP